MGIIRAVIVGQMPNHHHHHRVACLMLDAATPDLTILCLMTGSCQTNVEWC